MAKQLSDMFSIDQIKAMTAEQIQAAMALVAAKAAEKAQPALSFKIGEKGGLSVYGLGRFPVTLYWSQWERLLGAADKIRAFAKANSGKLKARD